MKTLKNLFLILIISFLFLQMTAYSQDSLNSNQDTVKPEKKVSSVNITQPDSVKSSIEVLSFAGNKVDKAVIGEKLKVRYTNRPDSGDLWIYIGIVRICKLNPVKDDSELYSFKLEKVVEQDDTLSKHLNPKNKSEISVKLSIGTDKDNIKPIADNFIIVFDKDKKSRGWWSGITIFVIFFISIYIFTRKNCKILRDQGTQLEKPPFSLSRTQMAFWTFIILIAYFCVWWNTGGIIQITGQVLALLGISAGTTIGGYLMDREDISNPKITKRHQENITISGFINNIISDANGLSIHRFQNVAFTIVIASYFLYEVWHNNTIPLLNDNLMILMGISSGTYLAIKKGENKAFKEPPVG